MADRATIASGLSEIELIRRAARAVADGAVGMNPQGAIAILAGTGNNGSDAFVAGAILVERGFAVSLFAASGQPTHGDGALARAEWTGTLHSLPDFTPERFGLVIDGLFGAGLARPIDGVTAEAIDRLAASDVPVLSIDLPSGVSGFDGQVQGAAVRATRTITFFRRKPGHLLQPGRTLCSRIECVDIGIEASVLSAIGSRTFANEPALFREKRLLPEAVHHKFDRGHAVVFSGGASQTGAARLAATAALRGGAGLVTVFAPPSAVLVNAMHLTAVMVRRCADERELAEHLADERLQTFVLGPGFGNAESARLYALAILRTGRSLVLDADGIGAFSENPAELFEAIREQPEAQAVLTPHDGEFKRLFPDLASVSSKLERAREAAARSGAVVLLKGSDTVIASPDGRAAVNGDAPTNLATAGSGDVLAGLVAAQLANGLPGFEAACAAVWIHAEAARSFGPGLIAEDLPGLVPRALARLAEDDLG